MNKTKLTLKDFFNLPEAEIFNPDDFKEITSVSIDSRNVSKNSLFIAIKGERFDGHDFVNQVVKKNVSAVMINKDQLKRFQNLEIPFITVKDTTKSLGDVAAIWRSKLKTKVIGITGSVGKTTTKEMLYNVLSTKYKVHKTSANNNNHIGVPLTILSIKQSHQIAVVEQGTNHFGEIKYTSNISKPDLALITTIGYSHLEFLINRKGVLKEKSALLDVTDKNGGLVFINNDDDLLNNYSRKFRRKTTFGFNQKSNYQGKIENVDILGKATISIKHHNKNFCVKLPFSGEQNAKNFLPVYAIAKELKLSDNQILNGIKKIKSVSKRLEVKKMNDVFIINDSYNANPDSMKASLKLLDEMKPGFNKIAILGDMFELGKLSNSLHRDIGKYINNLHINEVYTVGKFSEQIYKAIDSNVILKNHYKEKRNLIKRLKSKSFKKSVVLIKGSRGMKMEEVYSVLEEKLK